MKQASLRDLDLDLDREVADDWAAVDRELKDYMDRIAPTPQWLADIQAAPQRRGTDKLTMHP